MARKIDAYVDTSAFIAFLDRSDSHHSVFKRLFCSPSGLVTSALVVAEGHGWFLRRYDQGRAVQFVSFVQELPLAVHAFSSDDIASTKAVLLRFADQKLTFADAHGLTIMQQMKVGSCWSTDRHLGLTGVPLVI